MSCGGIVRYTSDSMTDCTWWHYRDQTLVTTLMVARTTLTDDTVTAAATMRSADSGACATPSPYNTTLHSQNTSTVVLNAVNILRIGRHNIK